MATLKVRNYQITLLWLLQPELMETSENSVVSELEKTYALARVPIFRGFTVVSVDLAGAGDDEGNEGEMFFKKES